MPHTNGKGDGQQWRAGKNRRKRRFNGEHDAGVMNVLKEKRRLKKRKQELKEQEENMLENVKTKYEEMLKKSSRSFLCFEDFPLSWRTLEGLKDNDYIKPTEIQRDTLAFSLTGSDVVGAAKTGSGKTLALVVPVLEALWRAKWSPEYGLGALVISPTRELALQTFSTINAVGSHHGFSCGLIIGGNEVSFERNRISGINIIVCTPGRLLQHMDENAQMNCDSLQILVLDEADRMLDMGFARQLNSIISNLPAERQTLLFSATQTRNVKDLSRVCTNDPVFVSVHENATVATPDNLKQSYVVVEEGNKINTLWSFIEAHKKKKSLVFVSSCKQARFLTEVFSQLRPGLPVMGLWGTMNQKKRVETFTKFDESKAAVLIATDVASRGLDFEHIDWVIQVDCPAQIDDYIHRVGRSARMEDSGNSLLMVTSSQEDAMVSKLRKHSIPIEELKIHPGAMTDIRLKLRGLLAESLHLKEYAQKSIVAYLRSIYTMKDKKIFNVNSIDAADLADSFGLISVPRIRFLDKQLKEKDEKNKKDVVKQDKKSTSDEDYEDSEDIEQEPRRDPSLVGQFAIDEDDDDIFTLKKTETLPDEVKAQSEDKEDETSDKIFLKKNKPLKKAITKVSAAKKILNKNIRINTKKTFDDDVDDATVEGPSTITSYGLDIEKAKQELKSVDKEDRRRFKELREQRRQEKLAKKKKKTEEYDMREDDDSDDEPDISWLPDPDAVRKKYAEEDNSDDTHMDLSNLEKQALALLGRK